MNIQNILGTHIACHTLPEIFCPGNYNSPGSLLTNDALTTVYWRILMDKPAISRQLVKLDLYIRENGWEYVVPLELLSPCDSGDMSIEFVFSMLNRFLKDFNRNDVVVRMVISHCGEKISIYEQSWIISQAIVAATRCR